MKASPTLQSPLSGCPDPSVRQRSRRRPLAIGIETLEPRIVMNAGDLDLDFSGNGLSQAEVLESAIGDFFHDFAIQADGKILAVGTATGGNFGSPNIEIARFLPNGTLDTTFGAQGRLATDFTTTGSAVAEQGYAIHVLPSGKFLVAGQIGNDFALVRYEATGALDQTFGTGGLARTDLGGNDLVYDLTVQASGRIVLAGTSDGDMALAGFTADGALDTTFGKSGKVIYNAGGTDEARQVALQADGKIVVAGSNGSDLAVVRFSAAGKIDTTFGKAGRALLDAGGTADHIHGLAIQADGRVVVAGEGASGVVAARFNTKGAPDTTFGTAGLAAVPGTFAGDVVGGLALAGNSLVISANRGLDLAVLRLTNTGALDATFDNDGIFVTDLPGFSDRAAGVLVQDGGAILTLANSGLDGALLRLTSLGAPDADFGTAGKSTFSFYGGANAIFSDSMVQPDGKYVVVGGTQYGSNSGAKAFIQRFNADGSLDPTFGTGGQLFLPAGSIATAVGQQPGGGLIVAGLIKNGLNLRDVFVHRISPNGTIDSMFGTAGLAQIDLGADENPRDLVVDPDGKIVIAATTGPFFGSSDFSVIRLLPNGALDPSFGVGGSVTTVVAASSFATAIARQDDGKYVVAGSSSTTGRAPIVRYLSNGTLDGTFSGDGIALLKFGATGDEIASLVPLPDGRLLFTGASENFYTSGDAVVGRLLADGTLDPTFGTAGVTSFDFGTDEDAAGRLAMQADGKILLVSQSRGKVIGSRLLDDGTLDPTFGTGGHVEMVYGRHPLAIGAFFTSGGKFVMVNGADGTSADTVQFAQFETAPAIAPAQGKITFGSYFYAVVAEGGVATVTVIRTGGSTGTVTVDYATSGGTATAGADYTAKSGTLTFGPGITSLTFSIPVLNDTIDEGQETIGLHLSNPTGGAALEHPEKAFVTIDRTPGSPGALDQNLASNPDNEQVVPGVPETKVIQTLIQPDGKIVEILRTDVHDNGDAAANDFLIRRYLPDGTLDLSFGQGGTVNTDFAQYYDDASSAVLLADGRLIVAGAYFTATGESGSASLARYLPNGSLDRTFGNQGRLLLADQVGTIRGIVDLTLLESGQLLALSDEFGSPAKVIHMSIDGLVDSTFGTNGVALVDKIDAPRLGVQKNGSIIVAGIGPDDHINLARLTAVGKLDKTFGQAGYAQSVFEFNASELIVQADDKIVVGGGLNTNFGVARFTSSGKIDPTFGNGGLLEVDYTPGTFASQETLFDLALARSGKIILLGGTSRPLSALAMVRVNPNGTLDTSFGQDGRLLLPYTPAGTGALAIEGDDRILFTAPTEEGFSFTNLTLGRVVGDTSPGQIDFDLSTYRVDENKSFAEILLRRTGGSDGVVTVRFSTANGTAQMGKDFIDATDVVTFASGQTTMVVQIPLLDDTLAEKNETVKLKLEQPMGGVKIGDRSTATLNIFDGPGVFNFQFDQYTVNDAGNFATVTVTRTEGSDGVATVKYATEDLDAIGGSDYGATTGTLNFADGQMIASFAIPILDDHVRETLEGVILKLSQTTGAKLGTRPLALLSIYDDDLRLAANPGAPDLSFGNDGFSTLDLGGDEQARATARQADGKLLVVGTSEANAMLGRFNEDGSIDLTFGDHGRVISDFGGTDSAQSVVVQADGKIVITGYSVRDGASDIILARYLPNGQVDRSFGVGGYVRTDLEGRHDEGFAAALQDDGRIVVLGSTGDAFFRDFAVVRYDTQGQLDETFGGGTGVVRVDFNDQFDVGADLRILPNGSILVAGTTYFITSGINTSIFAGDPALAKLTPTGALDKTFGTGGKVTQSFALVLNNSDERINTMEVGPDGKIYLGGSVDGDLALYRFNADGKVDGSFGQGGALSQTFVNGGSGSAGSEYSKDGAFDLAFDAQGRLLVVGGSDFSLAMMRLSAAGVPDISFGIGGLVRETHLGQGFGVYVNPDGKILTVGGALGPDFLGDVGIGRFYASSGDPKEGSFQFSKLSYSVEQDNFGETLSAIFTVLRPLGNASGQVSVDVYTIAGSAKPGVQYTPVQQTLTFEEGETAKYFAVPLLPATSSGLSDFYVALANPTGGAVTGSQPISQVVVQGATFSSAPSFSATSPAVQESATSVTITVTRSGVRTNPVSVDYVTVAGTATEGEDFRPVFGTLNFAANQTSATFTIPLLPDTKLEGDEKFTVKFSTPRGASLSSTNSTITILETDPTLIHNAGDLDTTWSGDGKVTVDLGQNQFEFASATALQADGKMVAVGRSGRAGDFALVRFNLDGTLDETFGSAGKVLTDIRPGSDAAIAVKVLASGKIQVVGTSIGDGHDALVLARYNADGTLDKTFGTGGKSFTALATFLNDFDHIAFQPDGKIVAAGDIRNGLLDTDVAVMRFNADGTLDPAFGVGGLATYDFGGNDAYQVTAYGLFNEAIQGVALQPDGKIVATLNDERLIRFLPNGQLDTGFGDRGILTLDLPGFNSFGTVASLGDGSLLVANTSSSEPTVFKLSANGVLDTSFGVSGAASVDLGNSFTTINEIAVQANGRIVLAGSLDGAYGLIRFYADGVLDIGFGAKGRVVTPFSGQNGGVAALLIQGDGRIVAAGGNSDFTAARYVGGVSAGGFRFDAQNFTVTENGGMLTLNVYRIGGMDGAVSVQYATANGTALAGTDYTSTSGTLTFGDRDIAPRTITVPITNDALAQGNLTFNLALSNPTGGAVLGTPLASATVTIADDEAPGKFIFGSTSYSVAEEGAFVDVTVQRIDGATGAASVRVLSSDSTATAGLDYTALDTIVNFADGEASKTVRLFVSTDALAELSETLSLTLSAPTGGAALGFRPGAQVTILDTTPTLLSLDAATKTVSEGVGSFDVIVTRSGPLEGIVSASVSLQPGTAVVGKDYRATSAFFTFLAGETSKMITIPIVDDSQVEGPEEFKVVLSSSNAGATLGISTETITITDDDSGDLVRYLSIGNASVTEGQSGTNAAVFQVTLSAASSSTVTVNYSTFGVTADNSDYDDASGQLTFAPGELTKTIAVAVHGDRLAESRENFQVALSDAVGAEIDDGLGLGTILDDDQDVAAGIQFESALFQVVEHAGAAKLTLVRGTTDLSAVTVPYTLAGGTAGADIDFTAASGTVSFAAGSRLATITVPVRPDFISEQTETFTVTLGTPSGGAILGNHATATVQIADDDPYTLPDLNNDDRPDLVTLKKGKIEIRMNPGDGAFATLPTTIITSVKAPTTVVSADFDGDGFADLAVLSATKKTISLLHGNGDGTFDAPVTIAAGTKKQAFTKQLIVGDFNGDGLGDLAVSQKLGVNVLFNQSVPGTLAFGAGQAVLRAKGFTTIGTGDFDDNGTLDLAVYGGRNLPISIYSGFGSGGFATTPINSALPKGLRALQLTDTNGDGRLDVIGLLPKNLIGVVLGLENSRFNSDPNAILKVPTTATPLTLAFGDVNDDLGLDFITTNAKKIASIITRQGNTYAPPTLLPTGFKGSFSYFTDLDGDDDADLVLVANNGTFKVVKR